MVIVAILGWAGIKVTEEQVSPYVDAVLVDEQSQTPEQTNSEEAPTSQETSELDQDSSPKTVKEDFNRASAISPQRRIHILYGDATGGGHLYGAGKPCKSEFPKHWDEDTVIKEVEVIAANDNLNWEQQRNGYYVTEQKVGTVKVRVVKGRNNEKVITAYPVNTGRNPCPANDRY